MNQRFDFLLTICEDNDDNRRRYDRVRAYLDQNGNSYFNFAISYGVCPSGMEVVISYDADHGYDDDAEALELRASQMFMALLFQAL